MKRGEVYLVNLSPAAGTGLRDRHYCVVVQSDLIEHDRRTQTIVVPFTSKAPRQPLPFVVTVEPPEGGLTQRSYAMCDQVTRIDKGRIVRRSGPSLSNALMERIDAALCLALEL